MAKANNATASVKFPTNRELALNLARASVPVFPCADRETARLKAKAPLTKNGFKDRTSDLRQVELWWKKWPNALVGLVPGDVGAAGIDQDIKGKHNGVAAFRALVPHWEELPATRTPSGGEHAWVQAPAGELGNGAGSLPKGIDIRCDHGYVCLGTLADGTRYEDLGGVMDTLLDREGQWPAMPAAIQEALKRPAKRPGKTVQPAILIDGLIPAKEVEQVRSMLASIPEDDACDYQTWLEIGMGLHHWSGGAAEGFRLWDEWSQKAGNYGGLDERWDSFEGVDQSAIGNAERNTVTLGTIYWRAKQHGWTANHKKVKREVRERATRGEWTAPLVHVSAGELSAIATICEQHLVDAGIEFFVRGGLMVRPVVEELVDGAQRTTHSAALVEVTSGYLRDILSRYIRFEKTVYRNKAFEDVAIDPPKDIVEIIATRRGEWLFPSVSGVISTPTLRIDGSILDAQGYDPETRLYMASRVDLPEMPDRPTRKDALAAAKQLEGLLVEFPFVDDPSYSVAMSALITPIVRGCMDVAPMHITTAPTAGTGKSYLFDTASAIAMGVCCPVLSAGKTEEEMGKRIGAKIMAGHPILCIDNVDDDLGGDDLCQVVERPIVEIRILGKSEIHKAANRYCTFATGNNLRVRGDMTRRTLVSSMDAKCERPAERRFDQNPVERVLADRGGYVAACLTIVRAYFEAGRPDQKLTPMGSFDLWSGSVRAALVWLGYADPCKTIEKARDDDPELQQLTQFILAFEKDIGFDEELTSGDIAERVDASTTINKELRAACEPWARAGKINTRALGRWLTRMKSRPISSIIDKHEWTTMIAARTLDGRVLYRLETKEVDKVPNCNPLLT